MASNDPIVDVVCCVLAPSRSHATIDSILSHFLPQREELSPNYAIRYDAPSIPFRDEQEMVDYFVENDGLSQAFFWNQEANNPHRLTVGAILTNDGGLVMTLTVPSVDGLTERYCQQLKKLLGSEIAAISYHDPAPFEDARDFRSRYAAE